MNQFLWAKNEQPGDDLVRIQAYMSGDDVILDRELLRFDIEATAAHAAGLAEIGVLDSEELARVTQALSTLDEAFQRGEWELGPPLEDGHSAIEFYLTEKLPEIGPKVHTGRSRNDQVQVALRLYLRHSLDRLGAICRDLAAAFLNRAERDALVPMPGYTHLQRAVPSSVGLWMAGFAESFTDITALVRLTRDWLNTCPLGTAAGYGVNLPLERETVAQQLQFERLQVNPMYVQNSRGRFELQALSVLGQATLEVRRFAWDLSLFTTQEFDFVRLPDRFCTGSSIMPNKFNPDFVELLRGQHAVVAGAMTEMQSLLSLPSGYQRDLQLTKPPLLRAFGSSLTALQLTSEIPSDMELNVERMRAAIDSNLYATDIAVERVTMEGLPFREAYRTPLSDADTAGRTPESSLAHRISPGAPGNLLLSQIRERLEALSP